MNRSGTHTNEFNAYLKPVGAGNLGDYKIDHKNDLSHKNVSDNVDTSNLLSNLKISNSGVR